MRASAAQKATTHGEKTEVGAAPEVAAAAAGQVEGEEDGKILGRIDMANRRIWAKLYGAASHGESRRRRFRKKLACMIRLTIAVYILWIVLFSSKSWAQRTDIVFLKNGDRITGEGQELRVGKLESGLKT